MSEGCKNIKRRMSVKDLIKDYSITAVQKCPAGPEVHAKSYESLYWC